MTRVITVSNRKGGVAKTTSAVSLGHGLALLGNQVLLVDTDPQGHVASALGLEQEPGLFNLLVVGRPLREVIRLARPGLWVLPGNQRTRTAEAMLVYEKADYSAVVKAITGKINGKPDYIIIDTQPSGVGFLQEAALWAADMVLIPSAVDYLSGTGIVDLVTKLSEFQARGWPGGIVGVLPTFYDAVTRESQQTLADLSDTYGEIVMQPIHRATVLRECAAEGVTIWEFNGGSRAREEYARVLYALMEVKV